MPIFLALDGNGVNEDGTIPDAPTFLTRDHFKKLQKDKQLH